VEYKSIFFYKPKVIRIYSVSESKKMSIITDPKVFGIPKRIRSCRGLYFFSLLDFLSATIFILSSLRIVHCPLTA
jgi:hypothetical protein